MSSSTRRKRTEPQRSASERPADGQPVWSWTDAVAAADVPPLTKLVCLNIARYLSSAGTSWRITRREMLRDTNLASEALTRHLKIAQHHGLLAIERGFDPKTGHRTASSYRPRFPKGVVLAAQPASLGRLDSSPEPRRLNSPGERSPPEPQVPFHKGEAIQGGSTLCPRGDGGVADATHGHQALGNWGVLQ
jgi:hypothetical protein